MPSSAPRKILFSCLAAGKHGPQALTPTGITLHLQVFRLQRCAPLSKKRAACPGINHTGRSSAGEVIRWPSRCQQVPVEFRHPCPSQVGRLGAWQPLYKAGLCLNLAVLLISEAAPASGRDSRPHFTHAHPAWKQETFFLIPMLASADQDTHEPTLMEMEASCRPKREPSEQRADAS